MTGRPLNDLRPDLHSINVSGTPMAGFDWNLEVRRNYSVAATWFCIRDPGPFSGNGDIMSLHYLQARYSWRARHPFLPRGLSNGTDCQRAKTPLGQK